MGRYVRSRLRRIRRAGFLKIALCTLIFGGAVAFDVTLSMRLVDVQPGDSAVYDQLAVNLLDKGIFSTQGEAPFNPTLIRTPGYPLFLEGIYEVAGLRNETAVRLTQAFIYLITCVLAGLIAASWMPVRRRRAAAGWAAFTLAAFCPFTASFSGALLTETVTMFLLAAMVLASTAAIKTGRRKAALSLWAAAGLIGGIAVMFRPDAGLFSLGLGLTLVASVAVGPQPFRQRLSDRFVKGLVFSAMFALPFVPWTIRNERTFGIFQPLAPTHAEMPGEFVPRGYYRWVRTWIDDGRYIDPMIWRLGTHRLKIEDVPAAAFSSEEEKQRIAALFDAYNNTDPAHPMPQPKPAGSDTDEDKSSNCDEDNVDRDDSDSSDDSSADDNSDSSDTEDESQSLDLKLNPAIDAQFGEIADERIAADPFRYYVSLPLKRSASMWFDCHSDYWPFTGELFPLSQLDDSNGQQVWLPMFAMVDLLYTLLSVAGLLVLLLARRARSWMWVVLVLAISVPRILFFGSLENPEPRYLIELFIPAAILGGIFVACLSLRRSAGRLTLEVRNR